MSSQSDWHTVSARIPFATPAHAVLAKQVIDVDRELQPHAVKRVLSVEDHVLIATFETLTRENRSSILLNVNQAILSQPFAQPGITSHLHTVSYVHLRVFAY
ncbi:unnamed protein product [Peniophora sp. CBMAI 1063]|nr:unnamed protein product [Peniophora sp. CBMAI 1063]